MVVEEYKTVLMFASGLRIAAQAPYLKQLHGYNARDVRTRRIHVIWQIEDIGDTSQAISSGMKLT